jgi:hypothetical protein
VCSGRRPFCGVDDDFILKVELYYFSDVNKIVKTVLNKISILCFGEIINFGGGMFKFTQCRSRMSKLLNVD